MEFPLRYLIVINKSITHIKGVFSRSKWCYDNLSCNENYNMFTNGQVIRGGGVGGGGL